MFWDKFSIVLVSSASLIASSMCFLSISCSSKPSAMFSAIVASSRNISCGTCAMLFHHRATVSWDWSAVPSIDIDPVVGVRSPRIKSIRVLLPLPVEPVMVMNCPFLMDRFMCWSMSGVLDEYRKLRSVKSMLVVKGNGCVVGRGGRRFCLVVALFRTSETMP